LPDPVGELTPPAISFLAYPGMNSAAPTADGGIGMMTCSVQNMRNDRGNGAGLFVGRRVRVRSVKYGEDGLPNIRV